jgi:hypothetical protein
MDDSVAAEFERLVLREVINVSYVRGRNLLEGSIMDPENRTTS